MNILNDSMISNEQKMKADNDLRRVDVSSGQVDETKDSIELYSIEINSNQRKVI